MSDKKKDDLEEALNLDGKNIYYNGKLIKKGNKR